jgi:hypothetical protein
MVARSIGLPTATGVKLFPARRGLLGPEKNKL